jgi:hypothetical protein
MQHKDTMHQGTTHTQITVLDHTQDIDNKRTEDNTTRLLSIA